MSLFLGEPHLSKKRNSSRTLIANGFSKKQGTSVSSNYKDYFYDVLSMEWDNA
jgi:hypothetical protein